ncbi:class II glutamine amidotransferase [Aliiroseovarius sp. 2305UL8-7]|uniref:class II glutamine amidotransferase n=1 Tax=Aliiroseovarius conchicola TaxID=3121637 RepID=UPI0035270584
MCRWAAYAGRPIFLDEIVTRPEHSLIVQSQSATECKTSTNGDGFGLAWYDAQPNAGHYRDIYPAWSDPNLRSVCEQVQSGLFLAHVRASTGSAISRNNCHPFTHERWSFMHNGQFGGFEAFRKQADMAIPDALYASRKGATDSEVLFLLALGEGLDNDPAAALERAARKLAEQSRASGTSPYMRLSVAMSDGKRLWAARASSDHIAPSVYYRWSASRHGWAVVSEPLEHSEEGWIELAPGHIACFDGADVTIAPFQP